MRETRNSESTFRLHPHSAPSPSAKKSFRSIFFRYLLFAKISSLKSLSLGCHLPGDASPEIAVALPKFTMIGPHNICLLARKQVFALLEVQITSPEDKTLIYGVLLLLS
jgi:hypothetical protein